MLRRSRMSEMPSSGTQLPRVGAELLGQRGVLVCWCVGELKDLHLVEPARPIRTDKVGNTKDPLDMVMMSMTENRRGASTKKSWATRQKRSPDYSI